MLNNAMSAEQSVAMNDVIDSRCYCKYCEEARWLKKRKPHGSRRMLIILRRHHAREQKKAAAETATG